MCWRSSKAVRQIAEEDIKTFKVGCKSSDGNFSSYYRKYVYIPSQKYTIYLHSAVHSLYGGFLIQEGFHSYNPKFCSVLLNDPLKPLHCDVVYVDEDGIHLLDNYLNGTKVLFIAECILPKGSEFYENGRGEIVSDSIIIERITPIDEVGREFPPQSMLM